jgi:Zn-dependent M28 family amino/carboxypeptidase
MRRVKVLAVFLLALVAASAANPAERLRRGHGAGTEARIPEGMLAAMHNVSDERIRADVKLLSSDEMEGRGTGAHGGELAAAYIAAQFKAAGVEPAGDNGGYLQRVPLVGESTLPATSLQLKSARGVTTLRQFDDAMIFNLDRRESADVRGDLIFIGYGITAPEFGWDDYAGVDVKGKVLLMLVSEPPSEDPQFFGGKALTYYGRWTYKFEQAARMGAAGVILIHKTEMASYGWDVVRSSWSGERASLADDPDPKLGVAAWARWESASAILSECGMSLDEMVAAAGRKGFHAVPLPVTVTAHVASAVRRFESANVIGKVSGSDPELKQQAIFFTGHYDHLGMRADAAGKTIYHGALDNATGAAIVMEMARAVAAAQVRPKRTLYFVATTAEEQGLWGSVYLVRHLPVPLAEASLDVNFDSIKPLGIPREVHADGVERTSIGALFEQTAADFKMSVLPPQHPEAGGYFRSDHFSFARQGVPAFSIEPGERFGGHPESWIRAESEAMDASYHQPTDEYKEEYDYRTDAVMARFGIALGYRVGALRDAVQWKAGDEFGSMRKSQAK